MPIFQDDLEPGDAPEVAPSSYPIPIDSQNQAMRRKCSEESIQTDLCEGPVPDSPKPTTPESEDLISDRAELIERLKRGESPTWVPHRRLESLLFLQTTPPQLPKSPHQNGDSPSLLPPADITPENKHVAAFDEATRLSEGLEIERPRSALHSGDFRQHESPEKREREQEPRGTSPQNQEFQSSAPWFATSPPRDFTPFQRRAQTDASSGDFRFEPSSLCSSLSASFAYRPPTSPLVQSQSNEELDISLPVDSIAISDDHGTRMPRRRTLTAQSSSPYGFSTPTLISGRSLHRRQGSFQAHQPQRPLTTAPNFSFGSPPTPAFLRSRRPSFSSDTSPLQAPMVGSYEESILRGRMSTNPSKPLDFLAQIGVLGIGKCKSSLRCPPHVTLPFPAVFYSYSNAAQGSLSIEDGPSPYVGLIDLENGLPNPDEELRLKRKSVSRRAELRAQGGGDVHMADLMKEAVDCSDVEGRKSHKPKRRSGSPKSPPGGSYRIPEKGQIQIIIKNQNKTAVKLFLVPYDLSGMEPGTKTFVRQRSYSTGPIIDNIPGLKPDATSDRPILRYLVHLHICCPSRGRFYLYKNLRVVFANRVPDGKEKLRNEITLPEPRFTPYKPIRVMNPPMSIGHSAGAMLAAERAFRRRSSGFALSSSAKAFDSMDGINQAFQPTFGTPMHGRNVPVEPVPFRLPQLPSKIDVEDRIDPVAQATTPESSASRIATQESPHFPGMWGKPLTPSPNIQSYDKLSKGDVGYGGNAFIQGLNGSPGAEGLLSKRLKSLEMKRQEKAQGNGHEERRQDDAI